MVRAVSLVRILRKEKTQMVIGMLNVFSLQIYVMEKLLIGMYTEGRSKSNEENFPSLQNQITKGTRVIVPLQMFKFLCL